MSAKPAARFVSATDLRAGHRLSAGVLVGEPVFSKSGKTYTYVVRGALGNEVPLTASAATPVAVFSA